MRKPKTPTGSLFVYLAVLSALSAAFIVAARLAGKRGVYLAQGYMLTPALAAVLTRCVSYGPGFADAHLGLGRVRHYFTFWLVGLAITGASFVLFTLLGAVTWDFTGKVFLDQLTRQMAAMGQDMAASLPPGFTPRSMLFVFFVAGITVFNVFPGIVTGFGEEFGARGLMFPLMYRIAPWVGFIVGGLVWYAWHLPLVLVMPQQSADPLWQTVVNHMLLACGSVCTAAYLAYVYVKSRSVWVTSVAHITLNNSARSLAYFCVVRNQMMANIGLVVTMLLVVVVLHVTKEFGAFAAYFGRGETQPRRRGAASPDRQLPA
jgi:membrane protease YdiL (CAAX protease family)